MTTHELALWAIKGMLAHAGDAPSPDTAKRILDIVDDALGPLDNKPETDIDMMRAWGVIK